MVVLRGEAVRLIWRRSNNRPVQAFLAGASAAVVGVILVVSIELAPEALVNWASIAIAMIAFVVIILAKVDVALVAIGAMVSGVLYAIVRALL